MAVAELGWLQRGYHGSPYTRHRFVLLCFAVAFCIVLLVLTNQPDSSARSFRQAFHSGHADLPPEAKHGEGAGVASQDSEKKAKSNGRPRRKKPDFSLLAFPPQPPPESRYKDDVILGLGPSDPEPAPITEVDGLRYAILMPTFTDHFDNAILFFQSLKCLCVDVDEIDIHVIVSDSNEAEAFQGRVDGMQECGREFSRFRTPPQNVGRSNPHINIVNVYDILPASLRNEEGVTRHNTSMLLENHGKYAYQSIKKWSAARHFDYDYALWLDSEAVAVHPFSIRETFDQFIENPVIFRSRRGDTSGFHSYMIDSAAKTLGRSVNSVGPAFWALESIQWIIEKEVINDLFNYVESAKQADFFDSYLKSGGAFEILVYNMHIYMRKLETVNSIFSKYTILETERAMIRFGLAGSWDKIEGWEGVGFLERSHVMFEDHESIMPNFSAFLRRYNQRLYRIDELGVLPPEVMDRFLLETPIDLICSSAPDLHGWWSGRIKKGEDLMEPASAPDQVSR